MLKIQRKLSGVLNILRFKRNNIHFGDHLRVVGKIGLNIQGKCSIGRNFRCSSGDMSNPMGRNVSSYIRVGNKDAVLKIGDNVGISSVCIWCDEKIEIGDNVKIGALTIVTDTDAHSLNPILRANIETDSANAKTKPVVICKNAFIGTSCVVCKGVTIGENSIVGAGSVVTKDIPNNQVWAGSPAVFIREIRC